MADLAPPPPIYIAQIALFVLGVIVNSLLGNDSPSNQLARATTEYKEEKFQFSTADILWAYPRKECSYPHGRGYSI